MRRLHRRALLAGSLPLLAAAGWGLSAQSRGTGAVQQRAEGIAARFGVAIGMGGPAGFHVPPWGPADAVIEGGRAVPVDLADMPPALDGIEASLPIYPPGFYAKLCKAIFFCGGLTLDGAAAGGTCGPAWIILVANRLHGDGGIYETARLGVHHEFSSLVWAVHPELPGTWSRLLPAGWTPARDNAEALAAADSGLAALADGFLSPYGATTAENDFNVYAEMIFTSPGRVRDWARAYPVVARKAALLTSAYKRLDGRMAAVFGSIGLGDVAGRGEDAWRTEIPILPSARPQGRLVR